ncbi:alpha/beta hydrolase [Lentibacillus songyuanensis]|uniref:alpha/beta hydrolase n=1 Tax=Lentibacillus songyuanensis TaxID=3136161 RepID=UPI0031BB4C66
MMKDYWLSASDATEIYVKEWGEEITKPKAIVQLAHGMVEHVSRYHDFATFLTRHNIIVFGNDHRGHGRTGERQGMLGYLAANDGFAKTADDLYSLTKHIKRQFPDTPLFLLGHSMGSFFVRYYLQTHSDMAAGVILSGTGFYPNVTSQFGRVIASLLPPKKPSKLMNYLAFHTYNNRITDRQTPFDWLSTDRVAVQAYMNDPYCGYIPTARFFVDLMNGLMAIHNQKDNKWIRHDLPMLLISGDADLVGSYGDGVWKTANMYDQVGLDQITVHLVKDARHELLNERNQADVYQWLLTWINQHLPA